MSEKTREALKKIMKFVENHSDITAIYVVADKSQRQQVMDVIRGLSNGSWTKLGRISYIYGTSTLCVIVLNKNFFKCQSTYPHIRYVDIDPIVFDLNGFSTRLIQRAIDFSNSINKDNRYELCKLCANCGFSTFDDKQYPCSECCDWDRYESVNDVYGICKYCKYDLVGIDNEPCCDCKHCRGTEDMWELNTNLTGPSVTLPASENVEYLRVRLQACRAAARGENVTGDAEHSEAYQVVRDLRRRYDESQDKLDTLSCSMKQLREMIIKLYQVSTLQAQIQGFPWLTSKVSNAVANIRYTTATEILEEIKPIVNSYIIEDTKDNAK